MDNQKKQYGWGEAVGAGATAAVVGTTAVSHMLSNNKFKELSEISNRWQEGYKVVKEVSKKVGEKQGALIKSLPDQIDNAINNGQYEQATQLSDQLIKTISEGNGLAEGVQKLNQTMNVAKEQVSDKYNNVVKNVFSEGGIKNIPLSGKQMAVAGILAAGSAAIAAVTVNALRSPEKETPQTRIDTQEIGYDGKQAAPSMQQSFSL